MTDVTARLHGGNEFSTAANPTAESKAARRARVLELIAAEGDWGMTSDEAEILTGWSHQTVSPRFTELAATGAIVKSGRRKTRSGRSAAVWVQQELWTA